MFVSSWKIIYCLQFQQTNRSIKVKLNKNVEFDEINKYCKTMNNKQNQKPMSTQQNEAKNKKKNVETWTDEDS